MRRADVPAGQNGDSERASVTVTDARPAVTVPPQLAAPLLRLLVRALVREAREDGGHGQIPAGLEAFLRSLDAASGVLAARGKDDDVPEKIEGTGMVTVAQLSEYSGFPPRTLRHWAARGRVRAVRAGRTWLIDPESLREDWRADRADRYPRS